ncbi:MAG: hypothetical protein H6R00_3037 [Proteobacteria bacterium]|nr:hypothetical protein [Pseudomonadota bacterium]
MRESGTESRKVMRVWMDPENALWTVVSARILFHSGRCRPVELGLAPMFILIVFASVAYLAIGFGFTMLSLHELATGRRDRVINRLMAWSGVLLWLPMLFVVVASAFFVSLRSAQPQVPAMAARSDAGLTEPRTVRRAVRQV